MSVGYGRRVGATLGTRLSQRDRGRFVGRTRELEVLESLLVDDPPASLVLVHGPGGIGKSTLLREVSRRAAERGWTPFVIEGRDLGPVADAVEDALAGARSVERPLLLFDSYERMTGLGGYLRGELLPSLPERAIVVIAGRRAPEAAWLQGGWENLALELELRELSPDEAIELLLALDVPDRAKARVLAAGTGGSPLALTLAASAARADPAWSPEHGLDSPDTVRTLIHRLADTELEGAHTGALSVASLARVVTVDMLREVLPRTDSRDAYDWLSSRTFAEPLGEGLTLHELVRKALHADLHRRHPDWARELRRRIADYLYARAAAGDLLLTIDMAHLVENAMIRWGYGWEGSIDHRIDDVRPGDDELVREALERRGIEDWWSVTQPYFDHAPERVAVVRGADDELCGFQVSVTPRNAPAFAEDCPVLGPWVRHAREAGADDTAVLWHSSIDFVGDSAGRVQAMLGMAGMLRAGIPNPRYAYLPIDPAIPAARAFAEALGARHVAEIDVVADGTVLLECHVKDHGEGGLLGSQRDLVYTELGLPPPQAHPAPGVGDADLARAVRDALRDMRLPHKLAASPLASGLDPEERAASVRSALEEAAEHAFGETESERLLHRVLVRGYLDPAPSHERAADELNVSRSTYFRRLRIATDRVADYVVSARAGEPVTTPR